MLVIPHAKEEDPKKMDIFRGLYVIQFVFGLTVALPTYIMSTYLTNFAIDRTVGLLYAAASIVTFILITFIPRILNRFGNYITAFTLTSLLALLTLTLAFGKLPWMIFAAFIFYEGLINVVYFTQDVFIENFSSDGRTGSIRGAFLTITNIAFLISPFMAGSILTNGDYWKIFSLTSITVTSVVFLLFTHMRSFKDPVYEKIPLTSTIREVFARKDVALIFIANFLLRFFYAWMIIYSPLYLHSHIGLPWNDIGIIFTIMLVPFVLIALPAGRIADAYLGEQEMLVVGFLIAGIATAYIARLGVGATLVEWIVIFFLTRIGASIIETMTETYFFKHIRSDDTHVIGLFRNINSVAYIAAPLLASLVLLFLPFQSLFVILGTLLVVAGIPVSLLLKDTK